MSPPPELQFRPVAAADLAVLAPWLEAVGLGVPAAVRDASWAARVSSDPRILCLTARDAGEAIVGFVRLDLAPDRTAEVTVLVAPEARRRGVGSALLERALTEARRKALRQLVALIQLDNEPAQGFFDQAGFEPTGRHVPGFLHTARSIHRAEHQPPLEISP